jgi:SAM-dependent methyltransferase
VFHPKYWRFISDFLAFRRLQQSKPARLRMSWSSRYPMLDDRMPETPFEPHYTYHPAWAARIIASIKPRGHVDVGSTLHFCSMVSAFVPTTFYDIRPASLSLSGLVSQPGDLMALPLEDGSTESLSCMHVVEHIGLGRYGDPLDPDGDLKAMRELRRVLARGGSLLFVVPVGRPVIRFNAHRIYDFEQIRDQFRDLELMQFALVDDRGRFTENATPGEANSQEWGCGCWWFRK